MASKAVVFDMDGTILDTIPDLAAVTNEALGRMGFPLHTQQKILTFVGNGAERLVEQATPPNTPPELRRKTLELWRAIYLECDNERTAPFPGIVELLKELRTRGVKTAVLSNKFDAAVRMLADQYFPGLFDIARGEIAPIPRKPDPTALLQVIDQLDSTPSLTAYVGDTRVDYEVARNAGVRAIGVSWGYDAAMPLPIDQLDAYLQTPADLLPLI